MASSSSPTNSTSYLSQNGLSQIKEEPAKHCWVCFANEDDDYSAQWTSPCKCRGTSKWVHKTCLQRWIDEKQQGNSSVEVQCPQCNSAYIILYPNSGLLVHILDTIDRIICKACPFLAGGILIGSVYWTAVTYGAVTIMQVLGHKEGLNVMEKADPLIMLIGLPTIPVMLMLGRLIRWEDAVLKFWRKHSTKLPLINLIFPNANSQYLPRTPTVNYSSNSDPVSFTRTICGGLILPTIATIFGKLLFQRVNSNFQRSIIGGIAFIGLKGIFKIYYKQQQYLRQAHRQIKNYDAGATSSNSSTSQSNSTSISNSNLNTNNRRSRINDIATTLTTNITSSQHQQQQSTLNNNHNDIDYSSSSRQVGNLTNDLNDTNDSTKMRSFEYKKSSNRNSNDSASSSSALSTPSNNPPQSSNLDNDFLYVSSNNPYFNEN